MAENYGGYSGNAFERNQKVIYNNQTRFRNGQFAEIDRVVIDSGGGPAYYELKFADGHIIQTTGKVFSSLRYWPQSHPLSIDQKIGDIDSYLKFYLCHLFFSCVSY